MTSKKPFSKRRLLDAREFFSRLKKRQISAGFLALYAFVSITLLLLAFMGILYVVYLRTLPPISSIEELTLPESSVIRDRDGNELYSLFSGQDGKRTYVSLDQISKPMLGAIVSTEDKTFFENGGIDFKGLVRSGWNYVTGKTDKIQGTSTISQQLIKNTFLSNERSLDRKLKEIYLSYRLNSHYSKEKILELYLNKISFGNNASGIEEASKAYFGKSAKDLGVLGSTILASLPKGPTYFSPYSHRDRLMGYLYVYKDGKTDEKITLSSPESMKDYRPLVDSFKNFVSGLQIERINDSDAKVCGLDQKKLKANYSIDSKGCSRLAYKDFLQLLNDIQLSSSGLPVQTAPVVPAKPSGKGKTGSSASGSVSAQPTAEKLAGYVLEYNTGRKDFVASRMLEDDKITAEQFKSVVVDGLEFQFKRNTQNIKYPHFVMYVQDYLTKKYGDDFFDQGGLQIYTTIDPKLEDKAEELVQKQVKINKDKYGANSAALVSLDNKTGQIVSMVGGPDYFSDTEQGKVNMITALRQPGSSFKPLVYSLAMSKEAISPDTPIFDVDTTFGNWNPDNYDKKFMGKMKVRTALDYSRNIPAIKMFAVAGGESAVVKHARSLGALSLREDGNYGMPLAIGTGELKPIELLEAYSVFANGGWKKEPTPILKIVDKKGNIIDQYVESNGKYVFSDAASYLLSVILSDASSRPNSFWNNVLTLKDRPVAAKTGTSNKDVSVGSEKKILPRDLWTAGYTPQYTTVVWAGNVDGTETKGTCDGLNCAAPIWHDFMEFAHKGLPVVQFKKPDSVYSATISAITGKLASEDTPDEYKVTSIFAVKPTKYESTGKEIEVDSLCNGKVTDATPPAAVKRGYLMDADPIIESYDPAWVSATRKWASSEAGSAYYSSGTSLIPSYTDMVCDRPGADSSQISVNMNYTDGMKRPLGRGSVNVTYQGANPIMKLRLDKDGEVFKEFAIDGEQKQGSVTIGELNFDTSFAGEHEIGVEAIDKYGYSSRSTAKVTFGGNIEGSKITLDNPRDGDPRISIYEGQYFNLKFHVEDPVAVTAVNVYVDGSLFKILGSNDTSFTVPIGDGLDVGTHSVEIQTTNDLRGKSSRSIAVEVLQK